MLLICPKFVNRKKFFKVGGAVLTEVSHRLLVVVVNDVGHYPLHRHYCMQKIKKSPCYDSSSVDWNKKINVRSRTIG
jgi:hypothetical protein